MRLYNLQDYVCVLRFKSVLMVSDFKRMQAQLTMETKNKLKHAVVHCFFTCIMHLSNSIIDT